MIFMSLYQTDSIGNAISDTPKAVPCDEITGIFTVLNKKTGYASVLLEAAEECYEIARSTELGDAMYAMVSLELTLKGFCINFSKEPPATIGTQLVLREQ